MLRRSPTLVLVGFIALATMTGCATDKPLNLLIITSDTTRADHIGCWGNQTVETPNIDRLAAEGTRFEHAYAAIPITLPSHTTVMTGLYPLAHGVRDNGSFVVTDEQTTIAEILADRNWSTAAAIGSFPVTSQFGLDQGFGFFDEQLAVEHFDHVGRRVQPKDGVFFDERRAEQVNEAIIPWLEDHAEEPFFAWIHYFDPHQPHDPPPPYDHLYADDLYDGEIAYVDECVGALRAELERHGVWDRTVVVFTADHGEGLGDHREQTHSFLNYNTTLHVPLAIKAPDAPSNVVVGTRVSLADIAPTVLDLLGISPPESMQGRSLARAVKHGEAVDPVPIYAETLAPRLSNHWGELRTLFVEDLKYIHGPRPELFDIAIDPVELADLSASHPEIVDDMRHQLADFVAGGSRAVEGAAVEIDDATRAQLEALGYVPGTEGATAVGEERLRQDGAAPQDRVADVAPSSQVRHLLQKRQYADARHTALELLERDPDNPSYLSLLVSIEVYGGRTADAVRAVDRLRTIAGTSSIESWMILGLAAALADEGQTGEALDLITTEIEQRSSAPFHYLRGIILRDQGYEDRWRADLETAVGLDPDYLPARVDLAVDQAQGGRPDDAVAALKEIIAIQPYFTRAHFNLGAVLAHESRYDEARASFRRAVQLNRRYQGAWRALVIVELELGDREAAEADVEEIERLMPGSPLAEEARGWMS